VTAGMLHKLFRILSQAVFPPKCLVCRNFIQPPVPDADPVSEVSAGNGIDRSPWLQGLLDRLLPGYLCPACIRTMVAVESPICVCCGLPFKSRQGDDHPCGECMDSPKRFRIARAPLVYEPILTRLVHCFKYQGKIQLAAPLSGLLQAAFQRLWDPDSIDMILPVPLHLQRLRKRGFNQAYLLVRNWETSAGPSDERKLRFRIERNVLVRKVSTLPQSALGRTQRAVNIKNAFELSRPDKILDKRILLIDDVYTTGATVDECARILLQSGAARVDVLTLARAV
jgi:ComF family protein